MLFACVDILFKLYVSVLGTKDCSQCSSLRRWVVPIVLEFIRICEVHSRMLHQSAESCREQHERVFFLVILDDSDDADVMERSTGEWRRGGW